MRIAVKKHAVIALFERSYDPFEITGFRSCRQIVEIEFRKAKEEAFEAIWGCDSPRG